ncbi:hypothetical protein ES703_42322 [subsurface metagenome]
MAESILIGIRSFRQKDFENERELGDTANSLSDFIYGKDSIYFHWEKRVRPSPRKYNVTDGLLLDLNSKPYSFWIVEYELASHSISSHVQPQVINFMRALRNPETLREIQLDLYNEIRNNPDKMKRLEEKAGKEDLFFFLDQLLHKKPGVLVVIDEYTAEFEDVLDYISLRAEEVRVLQLKRYTHGDENVYRFNTLSLDETVTPAPRKSKQDARERPPHHRTWEARIAWASPHVREWVETVKGKILTAVPNAIHGSRPKQSNYFFYTKEPQVHRNIFAVIMIQKQKLRVRFRLPDNFVDANKITKLYKSWFFSKGQERGVEIRDQQDLDLIDDYISIAYDYTTGLNNAGALS